MTLTEFAELSLSEIEELMIISGGCKELARILDSLDGDSSITAKDRAEAVKQYLSLRGPIYYPGTIRKKINKHGIWFIHSFNHQTQTRQSLDIAFDDLDSDDSVTISIIFDCNKIDEVISSKMHIFRGETGIKRVAREKSLLWYRDHSGVYNDNLAD